MYITFHDLLNLPMLNMAEIIAGDNGMERLIYHVQALDIPDIVNWIRTGDLIFTTGCCFTNPNEDLLNIIEIMKNKHAAGLIVSLGPYIKKISEAVYKKSKEYAIPLINIPYELHTGDIIFNINEALLNMHSNQKIKTAILSDFFFSEYRSDIEDRLESIEYNKGKIHAAFICSIDKADNLLDPARKKIILERLDHKMTNDFETKGIKTFSIIQSNEIVTLCQIPEEEKMNLFILPTLTKIQAEFIVQNTPNTISIGISAPCYQSNQVANRIQQAFQTLRNIHLCHLKNKIRFFRDIGIYRLFFSHNPDELIDIMNYFIGPLLDIEQGKEGVILETLDCYLTNNCQLGITAEELFIHKNTLKYRINRIKEILECDFNNSNTTFNIRLAIKIKKYLQYEYPNILQ